MERKLLYTIPASQHNIAISDFLKLQGFSTQNIIELKKMPNSVLVNGIWEHMNYPLKA